MVDHYMPKYPVKIGLLQLGHNHRECSEFQLMFVWMISSELLNLLPPHLVW